MTASASAEVPCPFCGGAIALPIDAVLALRAIACASCGASLTVDPDRSRQALDRLRRWQQDTRDATATAPATRWTDAPAPAGRGRRAARRRRA